METANDHIRKYLNHYIGLENPKYAVLLTGPWGSGKTHFIKKFIENLNATVEKNKNKIVLRPIYVSLNGISSVATVNDIIKKTLSPWLYSKAAKIGKKIFMGALKGGLKIDLGDKFSMDIDPISLLEDTGNSGEKITSGKKILIFDDIERCRIETDVIFGYINNFVEHQGCKVIVIGDEEKIKLLYDKSEAQIKYRDFKEKLIGHTCLLKSNTMEAIDSFLEEIKAQYRIPIEFLEDNKDLIREVFKTSNKNNLRILRQCFFDFYRYIDSLKTTTRTHEKFAVYARKLLAYFIIVYMEHKSGNEKIKEFQSIERFFAREGTDDILEQQYNLCLIKFGIRNSELDLTSRDIARFLETGIIPENLDETVLKSPIIGGEGRDARKILANYREEDPDVFDAAYNEIITKFKVLDISSINDTISLSILLFSLIDKKIIDLDKSEIVEVTKKNIDQCILKSLTEDPKLSSASFSFIVQFSSGMDEASEEYKEISQYLIDRITETHETVARDNIKEFFETLNNTSINNLFKWIEDGTPGNKTYFKYPIFEIVSLPTLADNIVRLTNKNKKTFELFLKYRYGLTEDQPRHFYENETPLEELRHLLQQKIEQRHPIDRYTLQSIIDTLSEAIDQIKATRPK